MSRPKGSTTDISAGRSTGRPETFGHRAAIQALKNDAPLTDKAAERELEVKRVSFDSGPVVIQEELALKTASVALVLADAISALSEQERGNTLREYAGTFGSLASKAFSMLETIRVRDADVIEGTLKDAVKAAREAANNDA